MVDRDDINRLTSATRTVLDEARRDLMSLAAQFDLANPAQVRDALLELVPMLVNEYGDLAAVAAAEWYEDVRPAGGFTTQLADVADEAAVRGSVQALAGGLWDDVPSDAIEQISASMERHIKYSSRATIARNVAADPMRPRYGRIPKGAKTCAWCEMLASRGFVYVTEETAGIVEDHYHDQCVIGSTLVSGPEADAGYRRYFEGEIVTLVTAAGHELTITPNHPVLTDRGWVKAGLLNEGDNLVSAVRSYGDVVGRPDEDDRPTCIEDAVRALGMVSATRRKRVPGAPEQFHGDGFNSEVDVVTRDFLFWGEGYASLVKPRAELDLHGGSVPCPVHRALGPRVGELELLSGRPLATSAGLVRGGSLGTALGLGQLRGSEFSGFGVRTNGESGVFQPSSDDAAADSVRFRERQNTFSRRVAGGKVGRRWDSARGWVGASAPSFDPPELESSADEVRAYAELGGALLKRLAGGVQIDRLVDKRVGQFSGHVFNLSTSEGWYTANSITVSNCDCEIVCSWDADQAHIAGYDPDAMYDRYLTARQQLEAEGMPAPSDADIAARMRELFPDQYTDGHIHAAA